MRRSRIWKSVKTWLCSFVSTGLYCLEKVTPGTEVFRMLANHHQSKVQSETSPTIYSLPAFKRITCTRYALEVNNFYSEFRLRSKIPCCVRNREGLRTQPGRLRTCGRSPHVYMNCAIARVLVTETVNCEAKAGLV